MGRTFIYRLLTAVAVMSFAGVCRAYGQTDSCAVVYRDLVLKPDAVSAGARLQPRGNIMPYPTRAEALAAAAVSDYVIPLTEWKRTVVDGGTCFTARFKVRYGWNNRSVLFRVDDVSSSFCVSVNGEAVGYSQAGTGRTEFDITDNVQLDYNTVSVVVFDSVAAEAIEAGRDRAQARMGQAWVVSQPAVRVQNVLVWTSEDEVQGCGYMDLEVVMQSVLLNPKEYNVEYELISPAGSMVSSGSKKFVSAMHSCDTLHFSVSVPSVRSWNHETPELYTLLVATFNEERPQEYLSFRIGFREAGCRDSMLTIDGVGVPLRSVRYVANPVRSLTQSKLAQFKEQGYNCIVVDGPSQPDYFYSLCDSLGMYVMDVADINFTEETYAGTRNPGNDPQWWGAFRDRMRRMYYHSQIHPCVVMSSPAYHADNGYCMYEGYLDLKNIGRGRPVFYHDADGQWNNDLDVSKLFGGQIMERSGGKVAVSLSSEGGEWNLVLGNNRLLTGTEGTYKVVVRSGRKKTAVLSGSFRLNGGGEMRLPLGAVVGELTNGNVDVELYVRKENGEIPSDSKGRRRVSDMYDKVECRLAM